MIYYNRFKCTIIHFNILFLEFQNGTPKGKSVFVRLRPRLEEQVKAVEIEACHDLVAARL